MPGIALGDANSPITEINDQARVLGAGATTATQLTSTKAACTMVEVTSFEGNAAPMMIGGSAVRLGTSAGYTDRIGSGVLYPGSTKVIAVADPSLLYQSGLATDWLTWTILK